MKPSIRPAAFQWTLAGFVWLGFAMVAVAGGIFRVLWLAPRVGDHFANLIETLTLVGVLIGLIWIAVPWLCPSLERRQLRILGVFWLGLTVAFEFLFGHFVDGASWSALFANYDITAGRLWILVPLTMGLGPVLVGRLKAPLPGQTFHQSPAIRATPSASNPAAVRHR
jgi:hypothetical protein